MNSRNTSLSTSGLSAEDFAALATARTSASEQPTRQTFDSLRAELLSSAKEDSQQPTGPSLLLSDPNIPKSTYESSSLRTTGAPSLTSNAIPNGQVKWASTTPWEKSSLPPGYPETNFGTLPSVPFDSLPYANMTEHNHSPLNRQIGGTHYKDFAIQPIEFIAANDIGFIEGSVIKYICRWRAKGGIQDLEKVKHYVEILIDLERNKGAPFKHNPNV